MHQKPQISALPLFRLIYDAVDVYDADIINMSWTLNQDSEELHEAICYAAKQNVLLVAAAGNLSLSTPLGSQVYPASWEEVIGVSGADLNAQGEPVSSLWYLQSDAVFVSADGNYRGEKAHRLRRRESVVYWPDIWIERQRRNIHRAMQRNI